MNYQECLGTRIVQGYSNDQAVASCAPYNVTATSMDGTWNWQTMLMIGGAVLIGLMILKRR